MNSRVAGVSAPAEADARLPTGPAGDDWLAIAACDLPFADVTGWLVRPDCGAQVTFTGTVRDNAEGRSDVSALEYEAYAEQALPRMAAVAAELRQRWPDAGRVALLHRTGRLGLGEVAVVVGVGAPHRRTAFEAASFAIDAVKASVPIWKREHWRDGEAWGTGALDLVDPEAVG